VLVWSQTLRQRHLQGETAPVSHTGRRKKKRSDSGGLFSPTTPSVVIGVGGVIAGDPACVDACLRGWSRVIGVEKKELS